LIPLFRAASASPPVAYASLPKRVLASRTAAIRTTTSINAKMVGTRVYLELFVKVQAGWRESRQFVEELDWRRQLEQIAGPPRPEEAFPASNVTEGPKAKG